MSLVKIALLFVALSLWSQTAFAMEPYFICNSTRQPVPLAYKCDNYQDCSDGSDEAGCGSTGCSLSEFMCDNGNCILGSLKCDGVYHCTDDSDEADCPPRPCTSNEFRCVSNGKCIRMLYRCNGENDCGDMSDEMDNCTFSDAPTFPNGCPAAQQFRCDTAYLSCISSLWQCDGVRDCPDGSDERNCSNGVTCPVGKFPCSKNANKQCIFVDAVCDGHRDCTGTEAADEDEDMCFHQNCNSDRFTCDDRCIDANKKCNGVYDCIDNSDEFNCTATRCPVDYSNCINGQQCYPDSGRCDGKPDCMDDSDEFLCPDVLKMVCEEGQFTCADELGCIPSESFCDSMKQCDDGSDEEMCNSSLVTNGCSVNNGGCEGSCIDTNNGRFCWCPTGFHIGGANRTECIDTDECAVPGTCNQLCSNTNGSYVCSCAAGYMMEPDGTCQASGPSPYLLVANYLDILRINQNGTSTETVVSNLTAVAVDFHFARDAIFWIDIKKKAIMRSNMDGSQVTELINYGMRRPEGLAVDWINDKIYWTDTDQDTIEVAGISGSPRTVLISRTEYDDPTGIVVDPASKMLFWIEHTRIMKASMDGSNVQIMHDMKIYGPTGLTLHNPTSTLYWVDMRARGIDSSHINGTLRRQIHAKGVMRPISVSVFEDTLYWLEGQNPAVVTTNRQTGEDTKKLPSAIFKPMDLVVVHPLRQPRSYVSPCAVKNGGCSYLCLLSSTSSSGYSCLCPFGTEHTNSTHCSQANKFLLFSRNENLHTIPLQQDPPTDLPDIVLPVSDIRSGGAVDWDSDTNTIFWADRARGTISTSRITGNEQKIIVDADIDNPIGIAVDWVARNLYWADKALSRICVSSLGGLHTTILLFEGFKDLSDIAVHPMAGTMFWVDNGNKNNLPIIERANLDGTGRTKIYSIEKMPDTPRSVVTAISIDYSAGKLYWVDRGYQQLNSINLDGSDKQTVYDGIVSPTGLVALNGIVFWADLDDKTIHWLNASYPDDNNKVIEDRKYLRRITLFHRGRPKPASHPCWVDNGGCSQLCLSRPGAAEGSLEATCVCRIGYQLQEDNRTCQSTVNNRFVFATRSGLQWFSEDVDRKIISEPPILPFSSSVISLDVDRENDTIYWIDSELKGIYRAPLKGGSRETIITKGLVNPVTVVVDWMGKNLYWADSGTGRIEVSRLNGDYRRVLVEGGMVDHVTTMIVDLKSHYMFWATSGPPRVYRAVMDGSRVESIISQGLINPVSLSIHNPGFNGIIYVMDNGHQSIFSYSLDGRQLGITVANTPSSVGLAYDNTYLYYVKRNAEENVLYRVRKSDGLEHYKLIGGLGNVRDMKYIKAREWLNRGGLHYPSPCLSDGPCSGLCLPNLDTSSDQYTCACSTGVVPDSNNACKKYPSLYILFSTRSTIQRISLDTDNSPTTLLINEQQSINFVDYDLGSNTVVWTDNSTNAIMTSDLNGNDMRVLKKGMGRIGGIAVDWITGNVFYTEPDNSYIGVMHPAGFHLQLSFSIILNRPTSIAVDPRYGYIFWINGPRLARASMDGSYSTAIRYVGNVEHLTMDVKERRLYWFKPDNGRVESVDYSGRSYRHISSSMESPSSFGFHQNFIFWVNSARKTITRARKSNGHNIFTVLDYQKDAGPRRIAVVSSKGRPGEIDGDNQAGPCSFNNGGCSHFCLATNSKQRYCACPSTNFIGFCIPLRGAPPPAPVQLVPTSSAVNAQRSTQLHLSSSPMVILSNTPTSIPFNFTTNQPVSAGNLSGGEISMLTIIVLLIIVVTVFVIVLVLFFFIKRKSLSRYRVAINPTSISAWNPTFRNRDSVSPTLSTLPRKKPAVSPPLSPSREKSNGKAVLMSIKTKSVSPLEEVDTPSSEFEKPEVYKMTPQQSRKSMSTPPASPLPAATTVQVVVNPMAAVHPPPPLPPKPNYPPPKPSRPAAPKPVPQIPENSSSSKAVKFDLDPALEPPPIPPRYSPAPF